MQIRNSKELAERGTLQLGDDVFFGNERYEVRYDFLAKMPDRHNAKIFIDLEYNAEDVAAEMYGYPSLGGEWPTCRMEDYEALTRLVAELYAKYENTIAVTFANMVAKLEGYPGKNMDYPRTDRDIQVLHRISHCGLGIGSEAGEIQSILKAWLQYKDPIDLRKLVGELGDLKHFIQMLCNVTGIDYDDLAPTNANKLLARFPRYEFTTCGKANRTQEQFDAEDAAFAKYDGKVFE